MFGPISLAPLKYDKSMFEMFFDSISTRVHVLSDGSEVTTANSYLLESLVPSWKEKNVLYSSCDGSGTSKFRNEAIYKSISEGLERLAFYENFENSSLGFNIDWSTTGMAAFPGLCPSSARNFAFLEAIERWAINSFWRGTLGVTLLKRQRAFDVLLLQTPFRNSYTVIIFRDLIINGNSNRVYGFACANSLKRAVWKSMIEMDRNIEVLSGRKDSMELPKMNLIERRLVFFACDEGRSLFDEKTERAKKNETIPSKPKVIVDSQINGRWDNFCFIHRVLFDGTTSEENSLADFSF